ncbi:MAG: hypothetical protein AB7F86_07625 [Bdellovibrionales bacterium]
MGSRVFGVIAVLLSISTTAFAQERPEPKLDGPKARRFVARAYGAPFKLDLSNNKCVAKGDRQYIQVLFYEEFQTLNDCKAAIKKEDEAS